jgi:hypothetical protein
MSIEIGRTTGAQDCQETPQSRGCLLIKSYGSRFGCSVTNCSRHNNLTIKRPAWTASENVEKVWRNRTASNCKGHKKDTAHLSRQCPDSRLILFGSGIAVLEIPRRMPLSTGASSRARGGNRSPRCPRESGSGISTGEATLWPLSAPCKRMDDNGTGTGVSFRAPTTS